MKFLPGEWLRSAESDIETMDEIIDNPHLTHVVAFHLQRIFTTRLKIFWKASDR